MPVQQAPKRKRSKGVIVGAAIAAVAIIGAGVFAITKISGNSDKGGAASPTDAGKDFAKALNDEDILGVVDLLLPGERDTFRQPMLDMIANLKRIKVLSDKADPSKVAGLDINLTNVAVSVDPPAAKDIDDIRLTATNESTLDGKQLPIGDLIVQEALGGKPLDTTSKAKGQDVDWKITTVQKDGRWYVSLFYSIAERMRDDAGGKDVPDKPIDLVGADQPDGALDQMLKAITKVDLPTIIGGLNPHEAEALQRYAPLFLDQAKNDADKLGAKIQLTGTDYDVKGSGDHRSVTLRAFHLKASAEQQEVTVDLKDGCLTVAGGDKTFDSCKDGGDLNKGLAQVGLDDNPQVKALVTSVSDAFADFKGTGIAVDQVDGKWFVSPIGTGTAFLNAVLAALDNNEITDIIDKAKAAVKAFDDGEVSLPGFGTDTTSTTEVGSADTTVPDTSASGDTTATDDTIATEDTVSVPSSGAVSAATFKRDTEDFIEGEEVSSQIGTTFTGAECETPSSNTVGTTYTCTAQNSDGKTFNFSVRIDSPSTFVIEDVKPA